MKQLFIAFFCLAVLAQQANAQAIKTRYIVRFRDKGSNPFTLAAPAAYLSQRAIDRRTRYGITIDSTDLPVTPRYRDSIRLAGAVNVLNASKWLNSVTIQTTDAAALAKINTFPFVVSVSAIASRFSSGKPEELVEDFWDQRGLSPQRTLDATDFFSYGSSFNQLHIHNGEFLHNIGLRGQSMIIGILDAGFNNYLSVHAFDSARTNGQILGTWDFVTGNASVNEDDAHGMECFSIIASNIPGQLVGTAPKASFYLFRSEDASSEYPIEEHNWVCAAERVDSAGGDLISSSLGYGDQMSDPIFNHTYAQMDGNTTMAAIGADLAAKKGILVVNAAGNEGTNSWHYILTPADGDSVMAVGAVDINGAVASFSSYGPSSDGQVKPDVASVGFNTFLQTPGNTISAGNGTSFACPNMAGLTACLWQGFPEFNNMKIINALRQSGSRATAPNDRVGYGIPNVKVAVMNLLKEFATSTVSASDCKATITWTSKDMNAMKYEIERKLPSDAGYIKIGEKTGTGTTFATHANNQFTDDLNGLPAGIINYRIRQVIDTSTAGLTAGYIDTVTLNLTTSCLAQNGVTVMPNPAHDHITLKVVTTAAVPNLTIRMINMKGQVVKLIHGQKPAGTSSFDIPIGFLAAGKYFITVFDNTQTIETREFLKL
jgi:subtilisin family serine protease